VNTRRQGKKRREGSEGTEIKGREGKVVRKGREGRGS
jgi:hypothetical protein